MGRAEYSGVSLDSATVRQYGRGTTPRECCYMTINGSQIITRALRNEGVDTIFTVAGDHILPLLDVFGDEEFRLIDCRHEQAAVHMADAWGRITGRLGVTAFTTPGHANAIPGLANAMSTESPVLNIAGSAGTPCRRSRPASRADPL